MGRGDKFSFPKTLTSPAFSLGAPFSRCPQELPQGCTESPRLVLAKRTSSSTLGLFSQCFICVSFKTLTSCLQRRERRRHEGHCGVALQGSVLTGPSRQAKDKEGPLTRSPFHPGFPAKGLGWSFLFCGHPALSLAEKNLLPLFKSEPGEAPPPPPSEPCFHPLTRTCSGLGLQVLEIDTFS